jgi:hypothetical protein
MQRIDGLDDRSLILEDGFLNVMRWGSSTDRIALAELGETEIVRDDKKKLFGAGEERIRMRFGAIVTAIWVPADQEQQARDFAAAVNAAKSA